MQWVFDFYGEFAEDSSLSVELVGRKAASLARMSRAGLPVPAGFVISTCACDAYFEQGKKIPEDLWLEVLQGVSRLEAMEGARFGDPERPLLLAIRTSPRFGAPGMMDAILSLGQGSVMEARKQLEIAIHEAFGCWFSDRTQDYRSFHGLPAQPGLAVIVQCMAFGNRGPESGAGIAFTRNPWTGERRLYGEYQRNAQVEDVLAGHGKSSSLDQLAQEMPDVYERLLDMAHLSERQHGDMQSFEFVVDQRRLRLLSTRTPARSVKAAALIAVDMATDGLIDKKEAGSRVSLPELADYIRRQNLGRCEGVILENRGVSMAAGGAAAPGYAQGSLALTEQEAEQQMSAGKKVILLTQGGRLSNEDVISRCQGLILQSGWKHSDAALVARALDKPCILLHQARLLDGVLLTEGASFASGAELFMDGWRGMIYEGHAQPSEAELAAFLNRDPELSLLFEAHEKLSAWERDILVKKPKQTPECPE